MTIRARMASARQSSNLADHPDKLTDVSVLAAAGMVATREAVGMALLRLRDSMDRHEWTFCLSAVAARVRYSLRDAKDKPSEREQHDLAELILRSWLLPVCPACQGRRYQTVPGTPYLSDAACHPCRGTGVIPVDHGLQGAARDAARTVAEWMDCNAHRAAEKSRGKVYG
ncbi:hypothetical protein [Methyloversatilis discipulorum]|uniref:hypothetical protein n=1 Tax=Methyloversatilis discipulorum TaxID=1119528 RepID=UPI0031380C14